MVPKSSLGRLGRPLGAHLGALGGLLGRSWGGIWRSWGALGRSWSTLGGLLDALGRSCTPSGPSGFDFGPSENRFSSLWRCLFDSLRIDWDASWRPSRLTGEQFAAHFTHLRAIASEWRATGEHNELTASIDKARMEVSNKTADRQKLRSKSSTSVAFFERGFSLRRRRSKGVPNDMLLRSTH